MKPILICFLILLMSATAIHAQTQEEIDEALKFYPLEVGNYWEYRSVFFDEMFPIFNDTTYYSIEVIADTTLGNGKPYNLLKRVNNVYQSYYEFDIHINDQGLRVAHYLERVDSATANIYASHPLPGDPFNEVLMDSLLIGVSASSNASRWPGGVHSTKLWENQTIVFGMEMDTMGFKWITGIPRAYNLATGFGLVYVVGGEGFSGRLTTLIYFRDHEGNEFGEPVHVSTPGNPEIPKTAALGANYPNPFNPSTVIPFELSEVSKVRLEVYDMLGRRAALLVNGTLQPGRHTAIFEAGPLPSGVYIARLQVGEVAISRKMLLVK